MKASVVRDQARKCVCIASVVLAGCFGVLCGGAYADEGTVEIELTCEENLFFSRYDIDVYVDGSKIDTFDHGSSTTLSLDLSEGEHTLTLTERDNPSVDGSVDFSVPAESALSYEIHCTSDQVEIDSVVSDETMDDGAVSDGEANGSEAPVEDGFEPGSAEAVLDETFPQAMAMRAAVVAMTNAQATDVFTDDGMTYDSARFHSYSDTTGFYMTVDSAGSWSAKDGNIWHVDGLLLQIQDVGTYLQASMDVSFDGTNYVVSGVTKTVGSLEAIDAGDEATLNVETLEPGDTTPFLTVSPSLVEEDRVPADSASLPAADASTAALDADSAAAEVTMGERNALRQAQNYLSFMPFSYSGLISQLEFEGYTTEEATYAVDNCGADWNEQAALKAQDYLDFMSFSRDGLIEQLMFEGFTAEQAEYGVSAVGY